MRAELKKLLDEINSYRNDDIDFELFDKVKGELYAGAKVEIFWSERDETDKGYIFVLPNQDIDEYDVCVHVPQMDNSDGMGDGDAVFKHLYSIVELERVSKIEVL